METKDNEIQLSTQIAIKCIDPNLKLSTDAVDKMGLMKKNIIKLSQQDIDKMYKQNKKDAEINVEKMKKIKEQYCTGHIMNKNIVFKDFIRSDKCVQCLEHNKIPKSIEVPRELTRKELLESEIKKLTIVKNEVKNAFINLLNTNPNDLHNFYNLLYNIQENIVNNDITRFTKELSEMKIN